MAPVLLVRTLMIKKVVAAAALFLSLASAPAYASTIILDKTPDLEAYWHPLDAGFGSYVYADSFVFTGTTGSLLDTVGIYLLASAPDGGDPFRFEVYADVSNAPDPTNVLGQSTSLVAMNTSLALVTSALQTPVSLVTGARYWIAASVVGSPDTGATYQVGGHTQNSIYADDGTFRFTNDVTGQTFVDPRTPEMAIYATIQDTATVPEPATLLLVGAGLGALRLRRRK